MKLNKLAIALSVAAGLFSMSAQASPITVGGVTFDPDSFFDFQSQTNLFEVTNGVAGGTISGYGKITAVNTVSNFVAPTAELTYAFGGYVLNAASGPLFAPGLTGINADGTFSFTGGWLRVYYDSSADFNALNKATATDGSLWLDLAGSSAFYGSGVTLRGAINGFSSVGLSGTGHGYFDAVGGDAKGNLDTNSQPGGADLTYNSSFLALQNPVINGGVVVANASGTNEIFGNSIPEPGSIALVGLGLLGLGASRRGKKVA